MMVRFAGDIDIDLTMMATGGRLVDSIVTNAYLKTRDTLAANCSSVHLVRKCFTERA